MALKWRKRGGSGPNVDGSDRFMNMGTAWNVVYRKGRRLRTQFCLIYWPRCCRRYIVYFSSQKSCYGDITLSVEFYVVFITAELFDWTSVNPVLKFCHYHDGGYGMEIRSFVPKQILPRQLNCWGYFSSVRIEIAPLELCFIYLPSFRFYVIF
jgi:hypothetical protein